jgi:transcriptional regulator with XRE-family HTH domain
MVQSMRQRSIRKQERRAVPVADTSETTDRAIVAEVGARLKHFRAAAGLTLEELCRRSGVSRAMLSKVERGEKAPTLTVMVRIAKGLDVSLTTLMGAGAEPATASVIHPSQRLTFRDPETGFERHVLSPSNIDSGVELLMHRIPPGQSSGLLPVYNVPTEKFLVVQDGQLVVSIGADRHKLKSGDAFYFEIKEPYRFDNPGKIDCVYYLTIVRRRQL